MTLTVTTRLATNDLWQCRTTTAILGEVVVSQARTPAQAQGQAARFLDANFPGQPVEWADHYEGGDTNSASPQATYFGGF